ncbi:pyridoxal phosphate-dependent aminotransferase [Candidatus Chloroploca asiatica]|uniref:Aminotransferase class I/II n=1 Tax=Candidatus Chloroploca asiatica TaxID=1506545 RepID=A0A2H3KIK1_9CHLR|nr:pyridoxal phosphate-dependent aminotransferase [Candidatus Chloroploca asiatica]PDV97700.1 aminotransferase class I/II [Candidatus Chloroploca asiatica]
MPGVYDDLDLSPNELELARLHQQASGGYVDLSSSNPTEHGLIFPPQVLQQAAEGFWASRRYAPDPHGSATARAAVAAYYAGRTPALHLELDDLFITASTSEAYALLFALLADPGDNLLAPGLCYPLFEYLAALRDLELRPYQLCEEDGWRIDEASLRDAVDQRTRAILLISPHNPTGSVIQQPVAVLRELGLPLICDEVFAAFTYAQPHVPPLAALHPELPVFTLNGISKFFALPDLKLGWIALNPPARHFLPRLELLNDTFLGANSLTQYLAPALFAQGMDFVNAMVARVRANVDLFIATIRQAPQITLRPPDGGYYLFPAVHGWEDEDALVLHLLAHGVLVHPGYFYGEAAGTHLLISALTEPTQFADGLTRLMQALTRS